MAEESSAEVELEQKIENVIKRVLEHHQQHLSQPNTKAGEPSKRASGGELHYCTSLPCEITSCHRAITKEIGYGHRAVMNVPYQPAGAHTLTKEIGTGARYSGIAEPERYPSPKKSLSQ